MTSILAGLAAGALLAGGWLALAIFCAGFGVVWGCYKIESAYYRLRNKADRKRRDCWHDARQVGLAAGVTDADAFADWICDGGSPLPPKHWFIYVRAMRWEFYQAAGAAALARGLRILFF